MKVAERDELLIRLDERRKDIVILSEKQEKHLAVLNNRTAKLEMNVDRNHNRLLTLENLAANGFVLKVNKKQMAGGGSLIGAIVVVVLAICKGLGWL